MYGGGWRSYLRFDEEQGRTSLVIAQLYQIQFGTEESAKATGDSES